MKNPGTEIYQLSVKSTTDNLSRIREFVRDRCTEKSVSSQVIDKIVLAVDEACSNIIKHAYRLSPDGDIQLTIRFVHGDCVIELLDRGVSFDLNAVPSPDMKSYLAQHRVGGLGIHLMRMLMDGVEYHPSGEGNNRLVLRKHLSA